MAANASTNVLLVLFPLLSIEFGGGEGKACLLKSGGPKKLTLPYDLLRLWDYLLPFRRMRSLLAFHTKHRGIAVNVQTDIARQLCDNQTQSHSMTPIFTTEGLNYSLYTSACCISKIGCHRWPKLQTHQSWDGSLFWPHFKVKEPKLLMMCNGQMKVHEMSSKKLSTFLQAVVAQTYFENTLRADFIQFVGDRK